MIILRRRQRRLNRHLRQLRLLDRLVVCELRQRRCVLSRRKVLERVLELQSLVAVRIPLDAARGVLVPCDAGEAAALAGEYALPLDVDLWALEQRLDNAAVAPVCGLLAFALNVLRDVVAALGPARREVAAEAAAPACAGCALLSRVLDVAFLDAARVLFA